MMAPALGCDSPASSGASASSTSEVVNKLPGVEVVPSSAPKITEEQFNAALDTRLHAIVLELRAKKYRSRMQLAAELGQRMQPQRIVKEVSKSMEVTDVSVLSLFARNRDMRSSVGQRVKQHAASAGETLMAASASLPMVVKQDCREAAEMRLLLMDVSAGKRQPSPDDRRTAPMVGAVIKECQTAAETEPELSCFVDAKDDAALKACL